MPRQTGARCSGLAGLAAALVLAAVAVGALGSVAAWPSVIPHASSGGRSAEGAADGDDYEYWSRIVGVELPEPAAFYYGSQAVMLVVTWILIAGLGGGNVLSNKFNYNLALSPSWMPSNVVMLLHKKHVYFPLCYSLVPLMALTAAFSDIRTLRIIVALTASMYALADSSVTYSHRDYLMVYNCWALALLPDRLAEGLALGFAVNYIASSGLAKVFIGGSDWLSPRTMRSILREYGKLSCAQGGPWSQLLNRVMSSKDAIVASTGSFALLFEFIIVPLSLFTPAASRAVLPLMGVGMVLLHVGIFLSQSAMIGIYFAPNVSSYMLGFSAHVHMGSEGWILAVAVVAASFVFVAVQRRLLPEDWPITPVALFGWSGIQWDILFGLFATGRTRLVVSTEPTVEPMGMQVTRIWMGGAIGDGEAVLYDAWNVIIGETTFQHDILTAVDFTSMAQPGWDATEFTRSVESWLRNSQRLFEIRSKRPVVSAYFVELTDEGKVGRILARGSPRTKQA